MSAMRQTDQRAEGRMSTPVRIRAGEKWADAVVTAASGRRMTLTTAVDMRRGDYVDIRRGVEFAVVGRVIRTPAANEGVVFELRDDVDLHALANPGTRPRPGISPTVVERRAGDRRPTAPTRTAERSRFMGALGQYGAIVAGGGAAAWLIASTLHDFLISVFAQVTAAM